MEILSELCSVRKKVFNNDAPYVCAMYKDTKALTREQQILTENIGLTLIEYLIDVILQFSQMNTLIETSSC